MSVRHHSALKRAVDIFGALSGLIILAPLFICVAVVVRSDGGPVLYRQQRMGRDWKPFNLLKFRSMRHGAAGPKITVAGDPRITRVGRVLRRTKVDELPQLINVLSGDMSLVGPRPEVPDYLDRSDQIHDAVLKYRPGLTDPASLHFCNEADLLACSEDAEAHYRLVLLPEKLRRSLEYAERATIASDILMILRTLSALSLRAVGRRGLRDWAPRPGAARAWRGR